MFLLKKIEKNTNTNDLTSKNDIKINLIVGSKSEIGVSEYFIKNKD